MWLLVASREGLTGRDVVRDGGLLTNSYEEQERGSSAFV